MVFALGVDARSANGGPYCSARMRARRLTGSPTLWRSPRAPRQPGPRRRRGRLRADRDVGGRARSFLSQPPPSRRYFCSSFDAAQGALGPGAGAPGLCRVRLRLPISRSRPTRAPPRYPRPRCDHGHYAGVSTAPAARWDDGRSIAALPGRGRSAASLDSALLFDRAYPRALRSASTRSGHRTVGRAANRASLRPNLPVESCLSRARLTVRAPMLPRATVRLTTVPRSGRCLQNDLPSAEATISSAISAVRLLSLYGVVRPRRSNHDRLVGRSLLRRMGPRGS